MKEQKSNASKFYDKYIFSSEEDVSNIIEKLYSYNFSKKI